MILAILGYLVAVTCISTYVWAAFGHSLTPNLWANALGGPIVALGNALVGYWPAVVLEVFFTLAGVVGLLRLAKRRYDQRLVEKMASELGPYVQHFGAVKITSTPAPLEWAGGEFHVPEVGGQ